MNTCWPCKISSLSQFILGVVASVLFLIHCLAVAYHSVLSVSQKIPLMLLGGMLLAVGLLLTKSGERLGKDIFDQQALILAWVFFAAMLLVLIAFANGMSQRLLLASSINLAILYVSRIMYRRQVLR